MAEEPENARKMTEHQRRFYQQKMKAIRDALRRGDEQAANRHAFELRDFFGLD